MNEKCCYKYGSQGDVSKSLPCSEDAAWTLRIVGIRSRRWLSCHTHLARLVGVLLCDPGKVSIVAAARQSQAAGEGK